MKKLVLIRHGESLWNKENRFTGWVDVDLSEKGKGEALEAGNLLKEEGYSFDICYTSLQKRAIKTLWSVLEQMDLMWVPVIRDWHLNERHYGSLQGMDKAETAAKYGDDQVLVWRRSYDTPPPAMEKTDPGYAGLDPRYASLSEAELPLTECLKDTVARFVPYWENIISKDVQAGKKVLIAAHGNSLRALVKHLEGIPEDEIVNLNIPTGVPLVYELGDDLSFQKKYYLGDQEAIAASMQAVANQGKSK